MKIVRELPRNNVETTLVRNAITTCMRHGIIVTQVDKPVSEYAFLVTAPHMGLVAAYATLSGVQDLIIRTAGVFKSMEDYGKRWKKFHAQHYRVLRMVNDSPAFAREHARVFYNDRTHVACDHRIPWKYYDAMQRGDRGVSRT